MITAATLEGIPLHKTATRRLVSASGLLGVGLLRDVTRPRPQAHGAINDTRYQDGQLMTLEGMVLGSSDQAALAEFHSIAGAALATLDTAPGTLKWTEAGGLSLQRTVKLAGPLEPVLDPTPRRVNYQLQLLAEDPRAYTQILTTAIGAALSLAAGGKVYPYSYPRAYNQSSGGETVVTNVGNRPTPAIFRVFGRATSPRVRLVGTDPPQEIVLSGEVATGDFLELDVFRRTVKLNGATNRLNLLQPADTTWFELPPGNSTVQLLANNFDVSARVDVIFRGAYA